MVDILFNNCVVKLIIFPTGTILGITNGFGTIPGWLAPLMAASFTDDQVLFSLIESTQGCSILGLQSQIRKNPASRDWLFGFVFFVLGSFR